MRIHRRRGAASTICPLIRLAIAPLVVLILVLGLYPKPVLALIEPSTTLLQTSVGVTDPAPIVEGAR